MTDLQPENKFVVPVTVHLGTFDQVRLRKFLNLHYLGDEDANEFVDGSYRAKYPEKETTEFQNAVWQTTVGYTVQLTVEFDVHGNPTFEVMQ